MYYMNSFSQTKIMTRWASRVGPKSQLLVGGFLPTPFETVKMGENFPTIFGVKIGKIFELPPPSNIFMKLEGCNCNPNAGTFP